ncbi:MAG: ATP-binding protein [Oscillospiraceae bacterium]|jgi:DNA replication protein DnaC|nr:ATP-binding protein [Oscillospiraceae bacterium]
MNVKISAESSFRKKYEKASCFFLKTAKDVLNGKAIENFEIHQKVIIESFKSNNFNAEYNCEICRDTGKINGKVCDCVKTNIRKKLFENFDHSTPKGDFENFDLNFYSSESLGEEFKNNDFVLSERIIMEKNLDFCIKYAKNFSSISPNILMAGQTGTGKTHLSLSTARKVVSRGFSTIYISAPEMVSELEKERFTNNFKSEFELFNCKLLILDDLGSEFITKFSASTVYNIINSRLVKRMPTIINTNLKMKDIEKKYNEKDESGTTGARIVSRLIGEYKRLDFIGRDIRQQKLRTCI